MNSFIPTISKEEISKFPLASFDGEIFTIDSVDAVDNAVKTLMQHDIIGFDTETKPSFKKGKSNELALIQLSTDKQCFIFRINMIGMPAPLLDILSSERITKIGLSLNDDFRALSKKTNIAPANFVELQNYVKEFNIEEKSLMKIFAILFQKRISKTQRLSNWEALTLSEKQKKYAALDAWATREIYIKLESLKF